MENTSLAMEIKDEETIINLIERAMEGNISLEEFYSIWPEKFNSNSYYLEIYDDLENAIEHFPADFFSGRPKIDIFNNSDEYNALKSHLKRLQKNM
jgi:hypothetical protein